MAISLFFSINVYHLSTQEFNRNFNRQSALIDNLPPFQALPDLRTQFEAQREQELVDAKAHVIVRLAFVNLFILVGGGVLSYCLARRSLRPIEEAHEAQSRFTADASHELRTPLAAMQAEIEVSLMNPKLTIAEAKDQLTSNLDELHKLTKLTEGLLSLAQQDNTAYSFSEVSLSQTIQNAIDTVLVKAETKKILITEKVPDYFVNGNKDSLIELFVILLDNAVKYSPNKSEVKVTARKDNQAIVIKVVDSGIGISKEDQSYIFDRFYRSDTARSKGTGGGYGLGLSIAKNIVDMHNGEISVDSTKDKGSTFVIKLQEAK